ncbi:MAG: cation-translocating P-type ATPase [Candidatus Bipolaricaulota bacterium]|nr:cation-translocating P-type ATPase [Candidatus Bipolaricaulota bacterium]MDW8126177.1 cation-translocating P-type ATPase [Candidatus Bipolaricaulota bacterium]
MGNEVKQNWHALETEEVLRRLGVDPQRGLSSGEAQARLKKHGPNVLPEAPPTPFWKRVLEQLKGFVILILLVATVISMALGDWIEAGAILAIVILNAFIGAIQESRAEQALQSLKKMAAPEAQVLRDGVRQTIPARELVPGDIVLLEAGSIVPADLRLLETAQLRVDESSLTGESVPVDKDASSALLQDTALADQVNMAFLGTTVVYGRGTGVVVATGSNTVLGEIAGVIEEPQEETPLQRRLEELGRVLGVLILIVCGVVFLVEVLRDPHLPLLWREGFLAYLRASQHELLGFFIIAVSLAVAAVPEGLPAVVTLCLAAGMREMLRRHALVRRLPSVETLGSATVICADKTGTLTQNQMTVTNIWVDGDLVAVTGQGYKPDGQFLLNGHPVDPQKHPLLLSALWLGLVCNDAELREENGAYRIVGDPTEGALLVAALKAGLSRDTIVRVSELPFDSERKRMTTIHLAASSPLTLTTPYVAAVKGAPDVVLAHCSALATKDGPRPLGASERERISRANEELAGQGLRVLAVAYRPLPAVPEELRPEEIEQDLIFLGLLGMQDPPRPEVAEALATARRAGLRTIMITGDHVATAVAIAKQIGLLRPNGRVISGSELDRMSDEELVRVIDEVDVFARVSPHHKVRIVEALRARGEIVAMTGDGVNDAPALKRADIGIAMGIAGTDVAKATADMVLLDDNYASIVAAVEQGRVIYANIRKTVYYLLSCNFAEIAIIFFAVLLGWPAPLTAIQLLWLNLLTDGAPALALGMEPAEPGIMERPPRSPKEKIINREMVGGVFFQAGALTAAVLGLFAFAYHGAWREDADTLAFVTLVVAELFRAYAARSEWVPLVKVGLFTNRWMQWAFVTSVALLLLVVYTPPLRAVFNTLPLTLPMWAAILPLSLVPFLVVEARKILLNLRRGHGS